MDGQRDHAFFLAKTPPKQICSGNVLAPRASPALGVPGSPGSKYQLQPELDDSRIRRVGDFSKVAVALVSIRSRKIRVIRRIEEFRTKLGSHPLGNCGVLARRKISAD